MENIKHKILVLSGKGGVGKSTIAVNLAVWLSMQGKEVGLLDIDIHGPSVPTLLNLDGSAIYPGADKIGPALYNDRLKVMSIGLLMQTDHQAVIWRGPMKHNLIKQFVSQVEWGRLDYLVVDCPPGTGDEPLSIVQLLKENSQDGKAGTRNNCSAVVVTTAQQLAVIDVKKCITFCSQLKLPVLGLIENMSGFVCPHCNKRTDIFKGGGGKQLAQDFNVPFLGSIPLDSAVVISCDQGRPFIQSNGQSPAVRAIKAAFEALLLNKLKTGKEVRNKMRIAIPLTDSKLSLHFGHCEQFAIVDVDNESRDIKGRELVEPPPHEPGALPRWLAGLQVELVITGGMGQRAQQLFEQNAIKIICGAPQLDPDDLVRQYLRGELAGGENICDH